MHLIADENKKRLWKLLRKFFTEKQLLNVNLQELYDYIDKGFSLKDFQDQTPSLPPREPTTDRLRLRLRRLIDESEATSPTEKPEGNVQSHVSHVATPAIRLSAQPEAQVPEGKSVAVEDDAVPVTSEEEISSDNSSGNASD